MASDSSSRGEGEDAADCFCGQFQTVVYVAHSSPCAMPLTSAPPTRAAVLPSDRSALPAPADVTALAQALVAAGTSSIAAGNHSFGDGPAPGVVKRLRVEIVIGGQQYTNETTEPGTREIPVGAEVIHAAYGNLRGQKRPSP